LLEYLVTEEEIVESKDPLEEHLEQDAQPGPRPFVVREERISLRKHVPREELQRLHAHLGQLGFLRGASASSSSDSIPDPLASGFDEVQMDGRDIVRTTEENDEEEIVDEEELYVTEEGHTLVRPGRSYRKPTGLRFQLMAPILEGHIPVGLLS